MIKTKYLKITLPQEWLLSAFWLVTINLIAFFWNLGSTGLIDETEPLFAEASRQITITGNWITPYFNDATRFDKPILIYWLQAIAYKLIGVNSLAVRLPSALAAIFLTCLCFFVLRNFSRISPQKTALIGSALAAFNLQNYLWAHQGVSDMLLSGCISGALCCFFWGYAQQSHKWYLAFFIFSGLAVLTKGPVGLILPLVIITAFLFYVGKLKAVLKEIPLFWGSIAFLLIIVPWYLLVILENGWNFINSFFGYHNLERFTQVVNHHSAPWYFYFLIVLGLFAPWSVYLPIAIGRIKFWRRKYWSNQERSAQLGLFAVFWFAGVFLFFTIAVTKLPSYVLPLIPAASILVAMLWGEEIDKASSRPPRGFLITIIFHLTLLVLMTIAATQMVYWIGSDPSMLSLAGLLSSASLPLSATIIWGTTAFLSLLCLLKKGWWTSIIWLNIVGFAAFLLFFVTPAFALVDQVRQLPLREIATVINNQVKPGERVMMIGFKKPSLVFYSKHPVGYFWSLDQAEAKEYLKEIPTDAPTTILLLGQPLEISQTGLKKEDYQVITQLDPYRLVRVERPVLEKVIN